MALVSWKSAVLVVAITLAVVSRSSESLPLSTNSRWIMDSASGRRVKLHCVNWAAHMQPMIAEGLDRKPLQEIASRISSLGFNCVRLTWATFMFANTSSANRTVLQSLSSLNLGLAAAGIAAHNPSIIDSTLLQAYDAVVEALGRAGLMVVLDNHVSRPQWCCGNDDGNAFFGDTYFDPQEWLTGLAIVAQRFKGKAQVVGMSLRNELRGPLQNEFGWYRQVQRAARSIHRANPALLVIVSGLNYDTDLSFVGRRPLALAMAALQAELGNKLVYEAHWYAFSQGRKKEWEKQSADEVCADSVGGFESRAGFVTGTGSRSSGIDATATATPLFISEFGVDQRGVNRADNRFLSCFLAFAAVRDMDWAMWALQGSYYLRNNRSGFEETYGVLDADWNHPRNPNFHERFALIHQMMQDPVSNGSSYHIIYHPHSGHCIEASEEGGKMVVRGRSCWRNRTKWIYKGTASAGPIVLLDTGQCLRVAGDGLPPILSTSCSDQQSNWTMLSTSKLQVAAVDAEGRWLCLQNLGSSSNSSSIITTCPCLCLNQTDCDENAEIQWFSFIYSNIA